MLAAMENLAPKNDSLSILGRGGVVVCCGEGKGKHIARNGAILCSG